MRHMTLIVTALALAVAAPAIAGKGGNGNGNGNGNGADEARASCSVAGQVVTASGLPTDELVNFMVTTDAGTSGWVLGYTPDGTWSVQVPAGAATYEFASRTYGPHGSKYDVFASCSS